MRWLLVFPTLCLTAFALLVIFQEALIYPFDPTPVTPTQAGEPRLVQKTLQTSDGETLVLWIARAKGSKPTILYFHGNMGNLGIRAQRFNRLLDRGYGVIAMAYRGSSGSSGSPSEQAITADAVLVRKSLPELLGHSPKGKVLYYGESLGAAVATGLATTILPDALILEAPFTSLSALIMEKPPFFPIHYFLRNKWDTLSRLKPLQIPLLILHGTKDQVIPYHHGKHLFQTSESKRKHLETLNGSGHIGLWNIQGQRAIYRFINEQ